MARANNFADLQRFNDLLDANAKSVSFNRNLNNSWGKSLSVVRSEILILAFALNSLRKTIGATIQAYQEWENVQTRIQQALKSTGHAAGITAEEIFKMNSAMESNTAIAETFISNSSALLLTFTNIGKGIFEETQKAVLDMTVAMNQGKVSLETLKSTSIQVGKALNNPIKGLNSLARNGVKFTNQQKTQIKTLLLQNDIMGAQKIILKELKKEFGGQSEIKDFAFSTRELSKEIGNLSRDIGGALMPRAKELTEWATSMVIWLDPKDIKRFTYALAALVPVLKITRSAIFGIMTLGLADYFTYAGLKAASFGKSMTLASIGTRAMALSVKVLSNSLGLLFAGGVLAGFIVKMMKANKTIEVTKGHLSDLEKIDSFLTDDVTLYKMDGLAAKIIEINGELGNLDKDAESNKGVINFFENMLKGAKVVASNQKYLGVPDKVLKDMDTYIKEVLKIEDIDLSKGFESFATNFDEVIRVVQELPLDETIKTKLANDVSNAFSYLHKAGAQPSMSFSGDFLNQIILSLENLNEHSDSTQNTINQLKAKLQEFKNAQKDGGDSTTGLTEYLQDQVDKFKVLSQEMIHQTGASENLKDSMSDLSGETQKSLIMEQEFGKLAKKLGIVFEDSEGNILSLTDAFAPFKDGELGKAISDFYDKMAEKIKSEELVKIEEARVNKMKNLWLSFADEVSGIMGDYHSARLERQQEAAMSALDIELAEVENMKGSERLKEKERAKIEKKREALEKKHHNQDIELKKKMVLVDLAMAIAKMWVAHAMSVPQVQAKWSWLPAGPAIAAAENAANRSVMMANLGMSVATSAMQIAALDKQKMATGGMIGGKLHSQGGTIIEAERGEFIMSRKAVNRIGLANLYALNSGEIPMFQEGGAFLNYWSRQRGNFDSIGNTRMMADAYARERVKGGSIWKAITRHFTSRHMRDMQYGLTDDEVGYSREYGSGGYIPKYQSGGIVMANKPYTPPVAKKEKRPVVVNFTGNVLSEDFIIDEAIPILKDAISRGEDIGI